MNEMCGKRCSNKPLLAFTEKSLFCIAVDKVTFVKKESGAQLPEVRAKRRSPQSEP